MVFTSSGASSEYDRDWDICDFDPNNTMCTLFYNTIVNRTIKLTLLTLLLG